MNQPICDYCDCVSACQKNPTLCPNLVQPTIQVTVLELTPEQLDGLRCKTLVEIPGKTRK